MKFQTYEEYKDSCLLDHLVKSKTDHLSSLVTMKESNPKQAN